MLSLFVRCIVIYFFLLVAMRLMGKRQLGELQPFEFAITLVASELACIPMGDPNIPIVYGIISVFTLFLVHIIITKLAVKSVRFRKVLNGKPVIVIERGNILPDIMKELNMNKKTNNQTWLKRRMKELTGHYRESNYDAMALLPYVHIAIERAEKLDLTPSDRWPQRVGTRVYLLAKSIIGLV